MAEYSLSPKAAQAAPANPGRLALALLLIFALALALRLAAWHWHAQYPLGGDEREYLDQALTLLRERRYVELQLMRPPLYTAFLAGAITLVDSLVQQLRLVQALVSALTVFPFYALARELFGGVRVGLAAALLLALDYTLALSATELLTETIFLLGLTIVFWWIVRAGRAPHATRYAILAGLALGALTLTRSVALPLLPLGALWLALRPAAGRLRLRVAWPAALAFVLAALLVILPWTLRNALTYHALIVVDTTGAENLWLDNDPAGREAVKRQLYALGKDRGLRQQLAAQRGAAAILSDLPRFAAKAWDQALHFFALQHFDDMRDRRAIWVPPLEAWLRLLLGDGMWLLMLLGGAAAMWLYSRRPASDRLDSRWLLAPWALYTLVTALIFHVELRYRLPLLPALLPYAAWLIAPGSGRSVRSIVRLFAPAATCCALLALTLLHRPYLQEAAMLVRKHSALWLAQQVLDRQDAVRARELAKQAIEADPETALGYVATARAWMLEGDATSALAALAAAEQALPAHPQAHILHGAVLRASGDLEAARAELAYEANSLQDLQRWSWDALLPAVAAPVQLTVGDGLDLGFVRGFYLAESGMRWSSGEAAVRLSIPPGAHALQLELASGRPAGMPPPVVSVEVAGRTLERVAVAPGWASYRIDLPGSSQQDELTVTLRSDTFRPRDLDRASPDGRALGVMVRRIEVVP
jgi:4-amino-4-deoxy-L-arabinose transferase-like glycosyltransferase